MELTPTAYKATLEINGETVRCTLTRPFFGGIIIKASDFSSSQNLSLMDIVEFIKTLCTEHGEEFGNDETPISLKFSPNNSYTFRAKDVAKQSVEEILKQIAKEFPFDLFVRLLNDTHNCE